MASDPKDFEKLAPGSKPETVANPSEEDVVRTLGEIEQSSSSSQSTPSQLQNRALEGSWFAKNEKLSNRAMIALVLLMSLLAAYVMKRAFSASTDLALRATKRSSQSSYPNRRSSSHNPAAQAQAESLLRRLASDDNAAAEQISSVAGTWMGKVNRSQQTDQFITTAINSHEMRVRQSALEAQLAIDGIPVSAEGLQRLTDALGNSQERVWALWLIGALGNRGVDSEHAAKIAGAYLSDPDVNVRASAVMGLSLIGTDETIPMLLDRFRNDPSPIVQERAACAIAESGMYTREQRLTAAQSLVSWE